jgi:hypothetical protein
MNRVIAVTATLAAATAATMAVAATIVPAQAAPLPATVHSAAHVNTGETDAKSATRQARTENSLPTVIGSELRGGKYMTVVRCQGVDSPPSVTLDQPGRPLTVNGSGLSAAALKLASQSDPYKTIYTCLVTVEMKPSPKVKTAHRTGCEIWQGGGREGGTGNSRESGASGRKGCTKPVTLNTGFGGLAPQVKGHHPAG